MNKHLTPGEKLKRKVQYLEEEVAHQETVLKYQVDDLMESLKPANLIKSGVKNIMEDPHARRLAIGASVGGAAIAITRKLLMTQLTNAMGKMMSSGVQFIASKFQKKKKRWKL